ncbi:MAG: hypothetical protein KF690_11685 [Bacteroidetes bacterium]|nr:hypothetical protein [Bacteroidota bacterium]
MDELKAMPFTSESFENLLPSYLVEPRRSSFSDALKQFNNENDEINYGNFYSADTSVKQWFQGDIIANIRYPYWDNKQNIYSKKYASLGILVTNTCDLDPSNSRISNKEAVFAPMVSIEEYLKNLEIESQKNNQIILELKKQRISNLLFLPGFGDHSGYVARLDKLFSFPSKELNSDLYFSQRNALLKARLSLFGLYLFVLKISYHFCRLPEDNYRSLD